MPGQDAVRDKPATIVCIHGAGGGGWEWAIWARVLAARGHAVLAPDLRAGEDGLEATTYADYRDQVLAWSTCARRDRPMVLLGASLGGLLALDIAGSVDADALILVNPLPPAPFAAGATSRAWPDRVPWGRDRNLASTRAGMPDVDDAACLHAFRRWRDESGTVLREACAGVAISVPQAPTMLLVSSDDTDVQPASMQALGHWLGATTVLLHGASHLGPLFGAKASALAAQACDWLDQRFGVGNHR